MPATPPDRSPSSSDRRWRTSCPGFHPLHVGQDAGGARLMLDGRPVSMGTILDLLLPGDGSVRVRVEGSHHQPTLYIATGGEWEDLEREKRCDCRRPDYGPDEFHPEQRCRSCGRLRDLISFYPAELECRPLRDRPLPVGEEAFRGMLFRWPREGR